MAERPDALRILLRARETRAPKVSEDLIRQIYEIEERVQFDSERLDAVGKIKRAVDAALTKAKLAGEH